MSYSDYKKYNQYITCCKPIGSVGPLGPRGPRGFQGPTGYTGPTGAQGPTGPLGLDISGTPICYGDYLYWNSNSNSWNIGTDTINLGCGAGENSQGQYSIAVGYQSGQTNQGQNTIAIGTNAGQINQGTNAIAIGNLAGNTNQPANSIVISTLGTVLDGSNSNACYIAPIRNEQQTSLLSYDISTSEITYWTPTLNIYQATTTIISLDTSSNNVYPADTNTDISFNSIFYSDLEPNSLQTSIFNITNSWIDFSNNQDAVSNILFEVSLSVIVNFSNQTNALTFSFYEINNRYPDIEIDTNSLARKSTSHIVCFGPQFFVFSDSSLDNPLKGGIWKVRVYQDGNNLKILSDARLTIKMKSIV